MENPVDIHLIEMENIWLKPKMREQSVENCPSKNEKESVRSPIIMITLEEVSPFVTFFFNLLKSNERGLHFK